MFLLKLMVAAIFLTGAVCIATSVWSNHSRFDKLAVALCGIALIAFDGLMVYFNFIR